MGLLNSLKIIITGNSDSEKNRILAMRAQKERTKIEIATIRLKIQGEENEVKRYHYRLDLLRALKKLNSNSRTILIFGAESNLPRKLKKFEEMQRQLTLEIGILERFLYRVTQ